MAVENTGGPASGLAHGPAAGDPAGNGSGLSVVPSRPASLAGLDMAGLGAQREFEPRIARMEAEMDAARKGGFLGLLRLRYEAWLEERMMAPAIRKMQARQAVLEQQCKTAEAEIRLKATVQSGEVGAQRHRIEWNEVNRQRLAGELHSLGLITYSAGTPAPSPLPAGLAARHGRAGGGGGPARLPPGRGDRGGLADLPGRAVPAPVPLRGGGGRAAPARAVAHQPPGGRVTAL